MGEYVFDHGWATPGTGRRQLLSQAAIAVPFTPATGPRLLAHRRPRGAALLAAAGDSCHPARACRRRTSPLCRGRGRPWRDRGWLQRLGLQFHWENAGYASFDDFLGALSSRKRKMIRRERRDAQADGLTSMAHRHRHQEAHWDAFYGFYEERGSQMGPPYLTRSFFSLLGERMGDRIVLIWPIETPARSPARSTSSATRRSTGATGADAGRAVPAFRTLLLPGHRLGDRARAAGWRPARRASTRSRAAMARDDILRPLDRSYRPAPRGRQLRGARTRFRWCATRKCWINIPHSARASAPTSRTWH